MPKLILSTHILSGRKKAKTCQIKVKKNIPENNLAERPDQILPNNFWKISPKPIKTGKIINKESKIGSVTKVGEKSLKELTLLYEQ